MREVLTWEVRRHRNRRNNDNILNKSHSGERESHVEWMNTGSIDICRYVLRLCKCRRLMKIQQTAPLTSLYSMLIPLERPRNPAKQVQDIDTQTFVNFLVLTKDGISYTD